MSPIRFENLTTSQILHESICKVAESGLEIFQTATFWDKFAFECSCFESFYPRKNDFLLFSFRAFSGSKVLNQNFCNVFNTKNKLYNASSFELCFPKRARFWIENWTACEISKKNFLRRVSFWKDSCIWKKQVWNWSIYSSRQKMFCVMGRFFKTCFSNIYFIARQIVNGKVSTLSLFEKCLLSKIDVFTCFISVKTTFLGFLHFQKAYSELKSSQRFRIQIQIRNYIVYQFLNEVF